MTAETTYVRTYIFTKDWTAAAIDTYRPQSRAALKFQIIPESTLPRSRGLRNCFAAGKAILA